ncbi:hypothetical protein GCM10009193_03060 [Shewanella aestuarii]|nr:hypothetical protein GCM10009193_03060 [Shewanella aestuarii]
MRANSDTPQKKKIQNSYKICHPLPYFGRILVISESKTRLKLTLKAYDLLNHQVGHDNRGISLINKEANLDKR